MESLSVRLYLLSGLIFFLPVWLRLKSAIWYIARRKYPEIIAQSDKFIKVTNWLSITAGTILFAAAGFQYLLERRLGTPWSQLVTLAVSQTVMFAAMTKLPDRLKNTLDAEPIRFRRVRDLMTAMPFSFRKERAEGVDVKIGYVFTGDEPSKYLLTVKGGECKTENIDPDGADMTVYADSSLWLDIANKKVRPEEAFVSGAIKFDGKMGLASLLESLFGGEQEEQSSGYELRYDYGRAEAGAIKKIVVFDGSPRSKKFSRTQYLAESFLEGAREAGAETEYVKLLEHNIKPCCGCFSCWSITPGKCVYSDGMPQLVDKFSGADLVVFATPLYFFSVTGTMKIFMDRLLPLFEPLMEPDDHGRMSHPKRDCMKEKSWFAVIAVSGFPEIEGNFEGILNIFRNMDRHGRGMRLMGEMLMPAAEALSNPMFEGQREKLGELLKKMGGDAARLGRIAKPDMQTLAKPLISKEKYRLSANAFWKSIEGRRSYLNSVRRV